MEKQSKMATPIIPDNLVVFICGVPGMGKTTISYELLKKYDKFRIIEETDLVREILRGYNDYLTKKFKGQIEFIFEQIRITDHKTLLSFKDAKFQCEIMKASLEQIVARQQRKGISTIINGVHIVPEVLADMAQSKNIIFINLYVTQKQEIYKRIFARDPKSYMLKHIPFIFQTNNDLRLSTEKMAIQYRNVFNVDVTELSIDSTTDLIVKYITNINFD